MLEREYKELMAQVDPSAALRARTAERMVAAGQRPAVPAAHRKKRIVTAALACVLVMALSVTALASAFPGFRELLFGKSSPVAESLAPVAASGEWNGIRMEVLGAMGDGNHVIAYFTLQDLEERNRLGETMSVIAGAVLNGEYPETENVIEGGMAQSAQVLEYNRETQTAFCRFDLTTGRYWLPGSANERSSEAYSAANASVELCVRRIFVAEGSSEYVPLSFPEKTLTTETLPVARVYDTTGNTARFLIVEEAEAADTEIRGQLAEQGQEMPGMPFFEQYRGEEDVPVVLKPVWSVSPESADFVEITAAGFLHGKFHIQYRYKNTDSGSQRHSFRIVCANAGQGEAVARQLGNAGSEKMLAVEENDLLGYKRLDAVAVFDLNENGMVQWGSPYSAAKDCYEEIVFDINPEELMDYEFFAMIFCSREETLRIPVKFDLQESLAESTASFGPVEGESFSLEAIDITPLGVYLRGARDQLSGMESLDFVCGEKAYSYHAVTTPYEFFRGDNDTSAVVKLMVTGAPVDPQEVTAVRVNGEKIPLR